MIAKGRRIRESPFEQGADEIAAYKITIPTNWGTATLSAIACKLYEDPNTTNTDRSSTMLTGSASASGQVITTQAVSGLTVDKDYRLDVKFTSSEGNTLECWALIRCTR
jgi:hypothetical protein